MAEWLGKNSKLWRTKVWWKTDLHWQKPKTMGFVHTGNIIIQYLLLIWIFQGDLDPTGKIFDSAVERFTSGSVDHYYDKFNPEKSGFGTHIRVLAAAALSTRGDILELGSGFFSTPLLDSIVRETQVTEIALERYSSIIVRLRIEYISPLTLN